VTDQGAAVLLPAPVFPENVIVFVQGVASEVQVLDPAMLTVLVDWVGAPDDWSVTVKLL